MATEVVQSVMNNIEKKEDIQYVDQVMDDVLTRTQTKIIQQQTPNETTTGVNGPRTN